MDGLDDSSYASLVETNMQAFAELEARLGSAAAEVRAPARARRARPRAPSHRPRGPRRRI